MTSHLAPIPLQFYSRTLAVLARLQADSEQIDAGYCIDAPEFLPDGFTIVSERRDYFDPGGINVIDDSTICRPDAKPRSPYERSYLFHQPGEEDWRTSFLSLYNANSHDEDFLDWLRSACPGESYYAVGPTIITVI
jgi:hypothetical protein